MFRAIKEALGFVTQKETAHVDYSALCMSYGDFPPDGYDRDEDECEVDADLVFLRAMLAREAEEEAEYDYDECEVDDDLVFLREMLAREMSATPNSTLS